MPLRITIADDHQIIRVGLRAILEDQGDMEVVAEAGTAEGALEIIRSTLPDVAIIDLNLPDGFGLTIVPAIRAASPATRILVLTMHEESDVVRKALASGIHGYVNKGADPDEVVRAVRSVARGRSYLNVSLEQVGFGDLVTDAPAVPKPDAVLAATKSSRLSDREREVLGLFARGRTHREIAEQLGLRLKTVETYRSRLGDKFGARSRADLVRCAREQGLIAGDPPAP